MRKKGPCVAIKTCIYKTVEKNIPLEGEGRNRQRG